MSDDGTRDVLRELAGGDPELRVLDNPARITPAALNRGIEAAPGRRSSSGRTRTRAIPPTISAAWSTLSRRPARATSGGMKRFVPGGPGAMAEAIALALGHPFGSGGARYRRSTAECRRGRHRALRLLSAARVRAGGRVRSRAACATRTTNSTPGSSAAGERVLLVPGRAGRFLRPARRSASCGGCTISTACSSRWSCGSSGGVPTLRQLGARGLSPGPAGGGGRGGARAPGRPAGAAGRSPARTSPQPCGRLPGGGPDPTAGRLLLPLAFGAMHFGYACGYLAGCRRPSSGGARPGSAACR